MRLSSLLRPPTVRRLANAPTYDSRPTSRITRTTPNRADVDDRALADGLSVVRKALNESLHFRHPVRRIVGVHGGEIVELRRARHARNRQMRRLGRCRAGRRTERRGRESHRPRNPVHAAIETRRRQSALAVSCDSPVRFGTVVAMLRGREEHLMNDAGMRRFCVALMLGGSTTFIACERTTHAMTPQQLEQQYGVSGAYTDTMVTTDGRMGATIVPVTLGDGRRAEFIYDLAARHK
jgi:hypothetical protein